MKITQWEFCHLPRENCQFNWPLRHGELMKRCRNTTPSIQTPDLASTRIVASHAPHAKPEGRDARLFPCLRLRDSGPEAQHVSKSAWLGGLATKHHHITPSLSATDSCRSCSRHFTVLKHQPSPVQHAGRYKQHS